MTVPDDVTTLFDAAAFAQTRLGLVLIDEAARVPDDIFHAVSPMLATCDGPMWLMSTPVGRTSFFWEAWSGALGSDWTRISVKATECPRIRREHLDRERRIMSERKFAQEYLCEFAEAEGQLFREDFLQRAIRHDIEPLDIPPLGSLNKWR